MLHIKRVIIAVLLIILFSFTACSVNQTLPGPETMSEVLDSGEYQDFCDTSMLNTVMLNSIYYSSNVYGPVLGPVESTNVKRLAIPVPNGTRIIDETVDSPSGGYVRITGTIYEPETVAGNTRTCDLTIKYYNFIMNDRTYNGTIILAISTHYEITNTGVSTVTISSTLASSANLTIDGNPLTWNFHLEEVRIDKNRETESEQSLTYILNGTVNGKDISHTFSISNTITY